MKNLIINKKYSITGKKYLIDLNKNENIDIEYLNLIARNLSLTEINPIKKQFKQLFNSLNNDFDVRILSNKNKKDYMNYLKTNISLIEKYDSDYFNKIFVAREELLQKLVPFDNLSKPVYTHNTSTGRSKIIEGINFMTMKKEKRIELSYLDFKVSEIDFKSCEPYFYLSAINKTQDLKKDIYESLKDNLNLSFENRNILKQSILTILYGGGYELVNKISKICKEDYEKIKKFFEIDQFSNKLIEEKNKNGFIYNFYNRPIIIKNERSILNYWVQSSVADFCYLSFNEFVKKNKDINFHAIIHDAIIFSSKTKINIDYLICPISKFKIPVSFSYFNE